MAHSNNRFREGHTNRKVQGSIATIYLWFLRIQFLCFCLLLIGIPNSTAQVKHYKHFGVEDGLLTNRITSLVEAPDGYIWVTTNGAGLSRFDGEKFDHYNDRDLVGSPYYFSSLRLDDELWFGGESFLCCYRNMAFEKYPISKIGVIHQMVPFQDSLLFCLSETGGFYFSLKTGKKKELDVPDILFNQAVVFGESILATTNKGVWKLDRLKWKKIYPEAQNEKADCDKILASDQGVYFMDRDRGLLYMQGDNLELILSVHDYPSQKITFLKNGDLGDLYFGTADQGIQIFQWLDSLWLEIDEKELQFPQVTDMVFDHWENAWVTSDGGGLTKFYTESFTLHQFPSLSGRYISKLDKWNDTLVVKYRNNQSDIILPGQNQPSAFRAAGSRAIASKTINDFQYLFTNDSLVVKKDSFLYRQALPKISSSEQVVHLFWIDSLNLLQLTNLSVSKLNLQLIDSIPYLTRSEVLEAPIRSFIEVANGFFWILGDDLLAAVQDSQVRAHTFIDHPLFLLRSPADDILLGTRDALYFVDFIEGEIQLNPMPSTATLTNFRSATIGHDGDLWITLQDQLIRCRVAPAKPMNILEIYDRHNGLPRMEFLEDALETGYPNRIYAGTSAGLLELLPQSNLQSALGPILSLVNLSSGPNQFHQISGSLLQELRHLKANHSDLSVTVKAIDQRSPQQLEYYYRLYPKDTGWIESKSSGNFQFFSLAPGSYRFMVKAVNAKQQESNIIEIPISVLNPFYLQGWFIGLVLIFVFALIYLFYRWRLQIQLRKREVVTENLKTENKILQLEQAAGRLQMNPHFIFNALQSIQSSIVEGDQTKARSDLQTFSKLMRSYLEHARVEKIGLEDELKLLQQYLSVEQELKGGRFDFQIDIDDSVDPSLVEIPTMLIQPFVENAIKHGQPRDGSKGEILIAFDWFGKYLRCIIKDNGPGIGQEKKQKGHRSAGMDITRQRLETYFKDKTIAPLTIENGEMMGTEVRVLLPVEM